MLTWLSKQAWWVKVGLAVAILAILVWAYKGIESWAYHRGQQQYIKESAEWKVERAKLIAQAEGFERERDEAKARAATYEAQAEKGKKLDEGIAEKVSELDKQAADEAAATDLPADCTVRADRTCAKLASLKPPIVLDCALYKRKLCQ